jgi:putative DNA primase/helicase
MKAMNKGSQSFEVTLPYVHQDINNVLPLDLVEVDQWVSWKVGPTRPDGKFEKIPCGRDGTGSRWQKESQWMSFSEAVDEAMRRGHAGVGLVLPAKLANGNYLVALDYDSVDLTLRTGNPRLEEIEVIQDRLGNPYAEESPSHSGIRSFVQSSKLIEQISSPNSLGGKDEIFCASGKWVTVTGWRLGGSGIPEATDEVNKLANDWQDRGGNKKTPKTNAGVVQSPLQHLINSKNWTGWPLKKLCDGDGRESYMLSYAGHLRSQGHTQDEIDRLCLLANETYYQDALDEEIVLDRAGRYNHDVVGRGVAQEAYEPNGDELGADELLEQVDRTDAGNVALLFNLTKGDVKYIYERKQWIVWTKNGWRLDIGNAQMHKRMLKVADFYMKQAKAYAKKAAECNDTKQRKDFESIAEGFRGWASSCRNKTRLDAMLAVAQRDGRFIIQSSDVDNKPMLLGVANGVVDLVTGVLRGDVKSEYVLKRSSVAYNPIAKAPRWEKFITEITSSPRSNDSKGTNFSNRPHLASYLQKALGYCLTGRVNEHVMFVAIGRGANGKNVLLDTFKAISGEYAETIVPEVLMATRMDGGAEQASPSARKLAGARCAISSESKEGQRLDVAVVKRHTGGGSMTARGLHESPMTFEITHKLWLMTNHTPRLDHMDEATKGRLHMIPFDMKWNRPGETRPDPKLPNADKYLADTLKDEYEGILMWLVRGAVKYGSEDLIPPYEVVAFTQGYIESQDLLARWIKDCCVACPLEQGMASQTLLTSYRRYCCQEDESPQIDSASGLSKKLSALGYASKRTNLGKQFALKTTEEPQGFSKTMRDFYSSGLEAPKKAVEVTE